MLPFWIDLSMSGVLQLIVLMAAIVAWLATGFASRFPGS